LNLDDLGYPPIITDASHSSRPSIKVRLCPATPSPLLGHVPEGLRRLQVARTPSLVSAGARILFAHDRGQEVVEHSDEKDEPEERDDAAEREVSDEHGEQYPDRE